MINNVLKTGRCICVGPAPDTLDETLPTVYFNQMTEMVEYDELLGSIEERYPSLASNLEDILWKSLNVNY